MSISELSSYINSLQSMLAANNQQKTATTSTASSEKASAETDNYISSLSATDEALPCENYNDILMKIMASYKSQENNSSTEYETLASALDNTSAESDTDSTTAAANGSAGGSNGASSDASSTTETEIVIINGKPYLQTTTTNEDGTTTITQEPLDPKEPPVGDRPPMPPMDGIPPMRPEDMTEMDAAEETSNTEEVLDSATTVEA